MIDIFFLIFSIFLLILSFGILRSFKVKNPKMLSYSILIACRNEEQNLHFLFSALDKIEYPKNLFEVIIVDDASSDNSLKMIKQFCKNHRNFHVLNLLKKDPKYKGKKAALKKAAEIAKHELLLLTDADCSPPSNWLTSFNEYISEETGMVVGFSPEIGISKFRYFTQIISSAIYSSTIGLGIPFSCAGGNIAIRKSVFEEISGYDEIKHYTSGDDKLLLRIVSKRKYKIAYNPDVKVPSITEEKESYDQQKRRYGKFGMSSVFYQIVSILILLFYIYFPYKILILGNWQSFILYFISSLIFVSSTIHKHKEKFSILYIPFLLIYPYYGIVFSFLGIFGKWQWKT